jgi:hypothetical protein
MLKPRSTSSPLAGRACRDDNGSVVVAMLVLLVTSSLAAVALSRVYSTQKASRTNQDFNGGLAQADGGLSDALFQVDQGITLSSPLGAQLTQCGSTNSFYATGTNGSGTYSYCVYQGSSPAQYIINSYGKVNRVNHLTVETVTRQTRQVFDFGIFGITSLDFNGNCSTGNFKSPMGSGGNKHAGNINNDCGVSEECFNSGTCPAAGTVTSADHPEPEIAPPTTGTQPCPTNGVFPASINGQLGLPFVCPSNVAPTFPSTVTVTNGPVIIYDQSTSFDPGCNTYNSGGKPSDFQVYVYTPGQPENWTWNGNCTTLLTGDLYAPDANITADGGKLTVNGSIVANQITLNGAPNGGNVDPSTNNVTRQDLNWATSNFHEAASTCVGPTC